MLLDHGLTLAQAVPSFDPSTLLTQGPLGVLAVFMFYLWGREREEKLKIIEAHKVEIAAERSLNAQLQEKRFDDQKILIPLAQSMVVSTEQTQKLVEKIAGL